MSDEYITDPAILEKLNSSSDDGYVNDPELLKKLNGEKVGLATKFGRTAAATIDNTVGAIAPFATKVAGYGLLRNAGTYGNALDQAGILPEMAKPYLNKINTVEGAENVTNQMVNAVAQPVGKAFGVENTPQYQNEAVGRELRALSEGINNNVVQPLSKLTGIAPQDIQQGVDLGMAIAGPKVVKPIETMARGAAEKIASADLAATDYLGKSAKQFKQGIEVGRIGEYPGNPSAYITPNPEVVKLLPARTQKIIENEGGKVQQAGKGWQALGEDLVNNIKDRLTATDLLYSGIPAAAGALMGGPIGGAIGGAAGKYLMKPAMKTLADRALSHDVQAISPEILKTKTGAVGGATNTMRETPTGMASINPETGEITPIAPKQSTETVANPVATVPKEPPKSITQIIEESKAANPSFADEVHNNIALDKYIAQIREADPQLSHKTAKQIATQNLDIAKKEMSAKQANIARQEKEAREQARLAQEAQQAEEFAKSPVAELSRRLNPDYENLNVNKKEQLHNEAKKLINENPGKNVEQIHQEQLQAKEAQELNQQKIRDEITATNEKLKSVPAYARLEKQLEQINAYDPANNSKRQQIINEMQNIKKDVLNGTYKEPEEIVAPLVPETTAPTPSAPLKPKTNRTKTVLKNLKSNLKADQPTGIDALANTDELALQKTPELPVKNPKEDYTVKKGKTKEGNYELRTFNTPYQLKKTPFPEVTAIHSRKIFENGYETIEASGKNGEKYIIKLHGNENDLYKVFNDGRVSKVPIKRFTYVPPEKS